MNEFFDVKNAERKEEKEGEGKGGSSGIEEELLLQENEESVSAVED